MEDLVQWLPVKAPVRHDADGAGTEALWAMEENEEEWTDD